MRGKAQPLTINGTDYSSTAAAIRSLRDAGLTRAQISVATGAQPYIINATLTDAVRAWPTAKRERMREIIMRSLATIADMTGVHEDDVLTFVVEVVAKERRRRIGLSMHPDVPVAASPATTAPPPPPIQVKDEKPVKQMPAAPKKIEATLLRPRPPVRKTAPQAGIDPTKLFNLRDPASGEWLHQTIVDEDGVTLTTTGKAYRYTQTVATIQRMKAKHKQFAGWELVPIVQVF